MKKNQSVRVYYSAVHAVTGERITGDAENHTIYISNGNLALNLTALGVIPEELSSGALPLGEYTFTLASDYTNVDSAAIIVLSSNAILPVVIHPIHLFFDDVTVDISPASQSSIVDELLDTLIGDETVQDILENLQDANLKFSAYPTAVNLPGVIGVPTAEDIASTVLATQVTDAMCVGAHSLAGVIMCGNSAEMTNSTITVYKPNGSTFFQKRIDTSEDLNPVARIYND